MSWPLTVPGVAKAQVVLTTSEEVRDVNLAYQLGANSFLTKPAEFTQLVSIICALQGYWLWMSKAPEISRPELEKAEPSSA